MSITIRPVNASLTRDVDTFTRMDPYVVIVGGNQRQRTQVCHEGGKQPSWNEALVFQGGFANSFNVQVWDSDNVTDDIVGEGVLNINPGMPGGQNYNVPIFHHGRSAGIVNLFVENNMGGFGGGIGGGFNGMGGGFDGGMGGGYGGGMGGGFGQPGW